jgi:hypothetical protein
MATTVKVTERQVHLRGDTDAEIVDMLVDKVKEELTGHIETKEGEAPKPPHEEDGLAHDYAIQQNSFWAMFYAEYWHLVNYMIDKSDQLFPREMGYEWTRDPSGIWCMTGDVAKEGDPHQVRFRQMVEMIWALLDLIVRLTPCLVQPVGMQHKFFIQVEKIHTAMTLVGERICAADCFLGPCSEMCGGELLERDKNIPMYHKVSHYRRNMKTFRARGGGACVGPKLRKGLVYHWVVIRDMIINLRHCSENAHFITSMMIKLSAAMEGEGKLEFYSDETYRAAAEEDPFFFGYRLREADWERTLRDCRSPFFSHVPFDFMDFVTNLATHTGVPVMAYLTPMYAYDRHFAIHKQESQPAFDFAWSNCFGLGDGGVFLETIRNRSKGEMEQYRMEVPANFKPVPLNQFGPHTSTSMRLMLNNNYHKNLCRGVQDGVKVDMVASTLPRYGVDDFHRGQGERDCNSFLMNWASRVCREHPASAVDLKEVLAAPTASILSKHILTHTNSLMVAKELAKEEAEEQQRKEEAKKKNKKKKKKKKKHPQPRLPFGCENTLPGQPSEQMWFAGKSFGLSSAVDPITHPDDDGSGFSEILDLFDDTSTVDYAPPRPMSKIMRQGAAFVIQGWWRSVWTARARRRALLEAAAATLQAWARRRWRVRDLKRAVCQIAEVRRWLRPVVHGDIRALGAMRQGRAARAIQRWYRHRYALWARHRQLVVFDSLHFRDYQLRLAEARLAENHRLFRDHVARFNHGYLQFRHRHVEPARYLAAVRDQLEWFLVTNLARDKFLQQHICPATRGAPLAVVMGFPTMTRLLHGQADPYHTCFRAAAMSQRLQIYFDPSGAVPFIRGINK